MALVHRQLVLIGLTIILDLLNASTVGNAVSASPIELRAVRLELAFENDLFKEHRLQPEQKHYDRESISEQVETLKEHSHNCHIRSDVQNKMVCRLALSIDRHLAIHGSESRRGPF